MKYDEHPSWRMLEKAKKKLAKTYHRIPDGLFSREKKIVKKAHDKICSLQYKLEDKLCRES
jgi:hypothetical protein